MNDPEKIIWKIRDEAMEDTKVSRELGVRFFFHWALLSGAALTLLMPFLSSNIDQKKIAPYLIPYIKLTIISFIVSLISASIRNFIMMRLILDRAQMNHKIANDFSKAIKNNKKYKTPEQKERFQLVLQITQYIAIFSFVIGIIATYIFISKIIF